MCQIMAIIYLIIYLIIVIIIIYYRKYLEDESLDKKKQPFDTSEFTLTNKTVSSNLIVVTIFFYWAYSIIVLKLVNMILVMAHTFFFLLFHLFL